MSDSYKKLPAPFLRGASCSNLMPPPPTTDPILIQTKNSSSSNTSSDGKTVVSSSPSHARSKKYFTKKQAQVPPGSTSHLPSKPMAAQAEGLISAYSHKKARINPLFNQARGDMALPRGTSSNSQSPMQRGGFVGSLVRKGPKIPIGSKYQQPASMQKAYSVIGHLPQQGGVGSHFTTPSTPSKTMLGSQALLNKPLQASYTVDVAATKKMRSSVNTLVLNESAAGVNKQELEQDERHANVANLRSFFPRSGASGPTHFNLSFNNSFNTQFPHHKHDLYPSTTKAASSSNFQFDSPDKHMRTEPGETYYDTETSETAEVAAKLEENFTNRLRELRDTPKPILNPGDRTTTSAASDSSELRMQVVSQTFEEVIMHDPCFSSLLMKIKGAYQEFIHESTCNMNQEFNQRTKRFQRQLTELEGDHQQLERQLQTNKKIEQQLRDQLHARDRQFKQQEAALQKQLEELKAAAERDKAEIMARHNSEKNLLERQLAEKDKQIAMRSGAIKLDKSLDEIIDDSRLFEETHGSPGQVQDESLQFKTPSPKREGGRKMPMTHISQLQEQKESARSRQLSKNSQRKILKDLKFLVKKNFEMQGIMRQQRYEVEYSKQRQNKLMYLLYRLQNKGYPVHEIFEKEIKHIPTMRFSEYIEQQEKGGLVVESSRDVDISTSSCAVSVDLNASYEPIATGPPAMASKPSFVPKLDLQRILKDEESEQSFVSEGKGGNYLQDAEKQMQYLVDFYKNNNLISFSDSNSQPSASASDAPKSSQISSAKNPLDQLGSAKDSH